MATKFAAVLMFGVHSSTAIRNVRRNQQQDCFSKYDGHHLLELTPCRAEVVDEMVKAIQAGRCVDLDDQGLQLPKKGCAREHVLCDAKVSEELISQFGKYVDTLTKDAGAYYRQSSGGIQALDSVGVSDLSSMSLFYSDWRSLNDMMSRVEAAVAASGGVASLETIGRSHEGRQIKAVRLTGAGYAPGKPKFVFSFQVHAREWITGMAGVYAVENMVTKAAADPSWIAGIEIVLVPMVNPDGFAYSESEDRFWRKNRRPSSGGWFSCAGTDINRNFPKDWGGPGSTSRWTCSDTYYGDGALSEPESRALAKVMQEAPMKVQIDVHSYSQIILAPWSWTSSPHPRRTAVYQLGNKMKDAIFNKNGNVYPMGDDLLYEASGVVADYATELGALGYTYELPPATSRGRDGFAPPASIILPTVEESLEGLYAAVDWGKQN